MSDDTNNQTTLFPRSAWEHEYLPLRGNYQIQSK